MSSMSESDAYDCINYIYIYDATGVQYDIPYASGSPIATYEAMAPPAVLTVEAHMDMHALSCNSGYMSASCRYALSLAHAHLYMLTV